MSRDTTETITSFLEKILEEVHPLMAEGMFLAAVPNWYDVDLFSAMRERGDGRDQGIIDRLNRYSFVVPIGDSGSGTQTYAIRPEERLILRRHWILKDADAYLNAHRRALSYRLQHPDSNPFAQAESRLYHQLQVDIRGGMDFLVDRFRAYHRERHIAAIDRLLETALDARFYLVLLDSESLDQFDDLITHLQARLTQLRGRWRDSLEALSELREKPDLAPWLLPYVARAYGYSLAQTGDFVSAIQQYRFALNLFTQEATIISEQASVQSERAHTMIAMGEAHVGLAKAVRGHPDYATSSRGGLALLREFFNFFLSLPLVLYLSFYLGRRVWHPRFWPTLDGLDWIVARLFATGARLYTRADPILEAHGAPAESVNADEQLAHLYLAMGDAEQAKLLFSRLLSEEEAPLGEYRRASVRAGLGEALLTTGDVDLSRHHLESALPVLSLYQDARLYAGAEMHLAEALLASGETAKALVHFERALGSFGRQRNEVMTTEVAERLQRLAEDSTLKSDERQMALQTAAGVTNRRYAMRFRHPATTFFHRAAIGLLAVIIFVIFAAIIRLDTGINIAPEITFNASPLLRSDTPDFAPDLSQGVVALNIATVPNPRFLLWLGAILFAAYLALSSLVGILAIIRMSLEKVQASAQAGFARFDGNELQVGEGEARQTVRLQDVTHFYRTDLYFADALLMDDSALTLTTADKRIRLGGSTTWYPSLRDKVLRLMPETTQGVDISYSLIRSWSGAWYLATIAALLLLSFLGQFAAQVVTRDIPFLRYSLADLYPLLYLGLFWPPIWWFVIQPLRIRLHTEPLHRFPWWIGTSGVLLALARALMLFRPWLTIPEIYAPLLTMFLVASAALVIFRVKRPETEQSVYPSRMRAAVLVVAALVCFVSGQNLWREVGSYHFRVLGDYRRDKALEQQSPDKQTVQLKQAIDAYSRAIEISEIRLLGMDSVVSSRVPLGIPPAERFTWVTALGSRAAMLSQSGQYAEAIDDYSQLLERGNAAADVYADRAIAYQGLGTEPGTTLGSLEVARRSYAAALDDFDKAIALDPENATYLLWRGVAHHALGEPGDAATDYQAALEFEGRGALTETDQATAWTGLGWISFVDKEYERAIQQFQEAEAATAGSSGAQVGLGYAYYSLRDYGDALEAWERAAELNPSDPIVYSSLGTLYWRIATLGAGDYGAASGSDRCSSNELSQGERSRSAQQLEKSILNLGKAAEIPGQDPVDLAFTFRTMGQVQFLLRNCPGYDSAETLKGSVGYYEKALSYTPDNAGYWHYKGRLAYSVWLNSPPGSGPSAREWLFVGLDAQQNALALNPEDSGDYRPNRWLANTYAEAVDGSLAQGDQRFEEGDYAFAAEYYELVAVNQPDHIQSAFQAGLAYLAAGEDDSATAWYEEGFERAKAGDDPAAIKDAGASLQALIATESSIQIGAIGGLFLRNGVDLRQALDASVLFAQATESLRARRLAEAVDLYTQGMTLAAASDEISLAATAAVSLQSTDIADDLLPHLKQLLSQLERSAGRDETRPDDAFKMGLFASAVGDNVSAGKWYNEGIRRSAININYPPLRDTRTDLKELWERSGVQSDRLLAQMSRQLPAQLAAYPELEQDGLYWRFRAWFKYGIGLTAFRLRQDPAAASALTSGQADADRAYAIDESGNAYVRSYLKEGAWGWYHVERGNDYLAADDPKQALTNFEDAVELIMPVDNDDVRNDIVIAAFKAGLAALLLSDPELSQSWYQEGVSLMRKYGSDETVLLRAIADLEALSEEQRASPREIGVALDYLKGLDR